MPFEQNVFINCPFDDRYRPLLKALLFTVVYLGFTPRIALENLNSGNPRFNKIVALIRSSAYGIHDLSRLKARKRGEFFRLNMPLELGLDVGCLLFKKGRWNKKKCLILETEQFRFQAAISDMSNSDIVAHRDEPELLVSEVRSWLNREARLRAPGGALIWARFNEFMADNYVELRARGLSKTEIARLDMVELMRDMKRWIRRNRV
jgi:hypothetical protein